MSTAIANVSTVNHPVVSGDQWLAERKKLLEREKELMQLSDQIARERRSLPWRRIDKNYVFDTPEGRRSLADLFEGRRQLMVQHFMLGPDWEQGCKSCSYMADHNDGANIHLAHRDVTLVAISRAPLAEIERFHERMGWQFKWVSSAGTDFNKDFGVSFTPEEIAKDQADYNYGDTPKGGEMPGVSVFYKDDFRRGLSHLLDVWAWRGGDDAHLQAPRPHAQGSRRGRAALHHGLGAPPRPLRAGAGRRLVLPGQGAMNAHPPTVGAAECLSSGGRANLRNHGAADGGRRRPAGHALLGRTGSIAADRHGADVPADGRLPFGGLAEADVRPTDRFPPLIS